jgi:hypothetical protein
MSYIHMSELKMTTMTILVILYHAHVYHIPNMAIAERNMEPAKRIKNL